MITGFAAIGFVLVPAIGATFWELKHITAESDRIASLRAPTAVNSARMANSVNASLATLRGWMLTDNESYKADWASSDQSSKLAELMAFFKIDNADGGQRHVPLTNGAVQPSTPSKPQRTAVSTPTARDEDGWGEF